MEDYADYLAEEARSDIVALHQFRILYDDEQETYHFFFEGEEDGLFYMPEARRHPSVKKYHIYDCGGKKNVIDARDAIKNEGYEVGRCLFFVDRDFDDLLATQVHIDEYTYITDGYSIENFLACPETANIIVAEIFKISQANPEFEEISNWMEEAFKLFYIEVRPLISWVLAAKKLNCSPNLRNTNGLKGIVDISVGSVTLTKRGFLNFKKYVVSNGRTPTLKEILRWRRSLDLTQAKKWVRGKYDIWFFHTALVVFVEQINIRRKAAGERIIRVPSALRDGHVFEILGGRIPPPQSLSTFLNMRLGN